MENEEQLEQVLVEQEMPEMAEPESEVVEDAVVDETPHGELPKFAKERLGRMQKKHAKEMRQMQVQMQQMQETLQQQQAQQEQQYSQDSLGVEQSPDDMQRYVDQAVKATMLAKQQEEEKARQMQEQQFLAQKQAEFANHLGAFEDKYEDFDDVVTDPSKPYTEAMKNIAMVMPKDGPGSAAEVLYKLGKNPEELSRISKLHPVQQAEEMIKLAMALKHGEDEKKEAPYQPMGSVKNNPAVSTHGLTENSPLSEFKKRARDGWRER